MKFSITIPAYKSRYLHEAIESVLNQSYRNFELIIVDDHSPEDLKKIVDSYSDKRLFYYRNEKNCGIKHVVDNWNICLSKCNGDYVICMGDDDRLMPNCLDEYRIMIEKHPDFNVYHAKAQLIDENSEVIATQESRPEFETAYEMLYNLWTYKRQQFIGDFCYNISWLRANKGYVNFPYAYSSDWVTAFLAANGKGIINGQKFMFQYRVSRYTISVSGNKEGKIQATYQVWQWYKLYIKPDDLENIYYPLLVRMLDKHFRKSIATQAASDLFVSKWRMPFRFVYWIKNAKNFDVSTTYMTKILCKYIVNYISRIPFPERV